MEQLRSIEFMQRLAATVGRRRNNEGQSHFRGGKVPSERPGYHQHWEVVWTWLPHPKYGDKVPYVMKSYRSAECDCIGKEIHPALVGV